MKTISIYQNTPTVVHVKELPVLGIISLGFGFNPGWIGNPPKVPTIRINVDLLTDTTDNKQIKIATYNSVYKIEGEGLVLEDHIYECCQQATYAMKRFLQFDKIGRSIPQELIQLAGKEAFQDDLIDIAKVMNATEGKRNFPRPPNI